MRPSCCRVPGLAALLGATLFLSGTAQQATRPQVLIKAGRLIDPKAGTVLANQAILVEGDRVKETGPAATVAAHAAAGARVIDLGAATVLPGLIDCHTHITSDPGSTVAAPRSIKIGKSTRLNSSHVKISYAVFCLKKKKK